MKVRYNPYDSIDSVLDMLIDAFMARIKTLGRVDDAMVCVDTSGETVCHSENEHGSEPAVCTFSAHITTDGIQQPKSGEESILTTVR